MCPVSFKKLYKNSSRERYGNLIRMGMLDQKHPCKMPLTREQIMSELSKSQTERTSSTRSSPRYSLINNSTAEPQPCSSKSPAFLLSPYEIQPRPSPTLSQTSAISEIQFRADMESLTRPSSTLSTSSSSLHNFDDDPYKDLFSLVESSINESEDDEILAEYNDLIADIQKDDEVDRTDRRRAKGSINRTLNGHVRKKDKTKPMQRDRDMDGPLMSFEANSSETSLRYEATRTRQKTSADNETHLTDTHQSHQPHELSNPSSFTSIGQEANVVEDMPDFF